MRLPGVLWHVTITLHGKPQLSQRLAESLRSLAFAHGIGLSARYSTDTVELRYWDEGHDCRVVAGHGLDLWDEHRVSSELPNWVVVGVEVLDRQFFQRRWPPGSTDPELFTPGVAPMEGQDE
jgi:hypothetical protein